MKKIITFLIISLIIVNVQARELNIETDASETSGFYGGTLARNKVEKMYFTSSVAVPNGIALSYDGSKEKDKSIMVWYKDADNNGLYEAHVGSESGINAPKKSENIFKNFTKLKKIDISKLNMINVSDVEKVFSSLSSLEEVVIKKSNILKLNKFASSMSNKYLILNSGIDSSEVKNIKDKDNNTKTGLVKTGDFIGTNKVIVLGDINSDGKISSLDYVKVKNHIMNTSLIKLRELKIAADYNEDEKISALDYIKIKNYIMEEVNNPSYEISFSLNGGSGDTLSYVSVKKNQAMPTISKANPTKSGYTFMGWYDNSDYTKGTQYYDGNQKSVKKYDKNTDVILYAGWKSIINILTIQYNGNGGTWNNPSNDKYGVNSSGTVVLKGTSTVYKQALKNGESLSETGLVDCNGDDMNWTKGDYVPKTKHEYYIENGTKKTEVDQEKSYTAKELASYGGCDLTKNSCSITVKVNWVYQVKIASFNVGYFACGSSKISCSPKVSDFVNLINQYKIDIMGMQEARNNGFNTNYATSIGDNSGLTNKYITRPANINAIISKYAFKSKSSTTMTGGETRSLDKVIININGVDISYYNTHLGLSTNNSAHFQIMADVVKEDPNPVIITADYNTVPITKFQTYLEPLGFEVAAYDNLTDNMWGKESYCDAVFVNPKGHIDLVTFESVLAYKLYSDHNLVIATLAVH